MPFEKPRQNLALPFAIQKRLDTMLAGSTGLSGPEMVEYFSHLDPNVEQYSWAGGMPSRKQILQDCLARFPKERQLGIIEDLLTSDIYRKYSPPPIEDVEFVKQWLHSQTIPARTSTQMALGSSVINPPARSVSPKWDVFISHASEDKDHLARPLATALEANGVRVWFDELTLTVGDSLRRSIDRGLAHSEFGIVILSHSFFSKHWPQLELDGLVAREANGTKVILPVWHGLDYADIVKHSPILADRLAVSSKSGIENVVHSLIQVIRPNQPVAAGLPNQPASEQISSLAQGLRASYPGDRERAAREIGALGPRAAPLVHSLVKCLKDASGPVRHAAAFALAAIGTPEALHALHEYESR